jgi:UDP-N-acetyl-2-amino-2-deoxyglucuronate dehydrogenase
MSLRIGFIGTGAIANLHARAHRNIGNVIVACTSLVEEEGRRFAAEHGGEFHAGYETVCRHPDADVIDICTFPDFRLQPLELAAKHGKHVQVEKPIAIDTRTARAMIDTARRAGVVLGVVSQHRFDDASQFLAAAIPAGRLGKLIQCDAYVKWHRSDAYYSRPIKGSWATEGGGALINQAIHQVDLLRWLVGPVRDVAAMWQIGATHKIESEDVVTALLRYENGATGVIQASTSIVPGYPERLELHGSKGTAIISGDRLVAWDVPNDAGDPAPVATNVASGASDPMAISLTPFERQFRDYEDAVRHKREPLISGEAGYQALEIVERIYTACRAR